MVSDDVTYLVEFDAHSAYMSTLVSHSYESCTARECFEAQEILNRTHEFLLDC